MLGDWLTTVLATFAVAFTPLAVPMLSGPGSIAVTIGMAAGAESVSEGIDALTRILGFLLVCIGVQSIGIGVIEVAHDPMVLGPILDAIGRAGSS